VIRALPSVPPLARRSGEDARARGGAAAGRRSSICNPGSRHEPADDEMNDLHPGLTVLSAQWPRMRVLVVEDEVKLGELVARGLREEGYAADLTDRGQEALWMAKAAQYDAILLDVMLPGSDGFSVCRRLRDEGVWSPVLMLTARDAVGDRVAGLDAGADDYLAKPFAFDELLARLRALARRAPRERPTVLAVGDLRVDPAQRRVWRGDTEVRLTTKEFALLETFVRNPGVVLSRSQLLDAAWDMSYERRSNVVDVNVRYLREKIDRPFGRASLETVRGVGYRLRGER